MNKYATNWEKETRVCRTCNVEKPFSEYNCTQPKPSAKVYPLPTCRLCVNAKKVSRYNNDADFKYGQLAHSQNLSAKKTYGRDPIEKISAEFVKKILTAESCVYCGCPNNNITFHLDHAIPLSKGGSHTEDNIVPACEFCNMAKQDKSVAVYKTWLSGVRHGFS